MLLFVWMRYVPVNNFSVRSDDFLSSWAEPEQNSGKSVLLKETTQ